MDNPIGTVSTPSGERWPTLGLGTWRMGESTRARQAEVGAVREALELGYRLIDTAEMYADGAAEQVVGTALQQALRAGLDRRSLIVVTKALPQHAGFDDLQRAAERSLRRLRVEQIDLYLLHWRGSVPLQQTVDGFEALRARGLIRHWGVSNFDIDDLDELAGVRSGHRCQANQVYYSLAARGIEFDLLPRQRSQSMPLMAYSPIDQGALTEEPKLADIARRAAISPARLALAWVLRHDGVIAIPKAVSSAHLSDNLAAASLQLDDATLAELDRLFPPPRHKQPLAMT